MELISRADAIKDAESWVAADEHERRLQKNVIEWLKEFPPAELGTDCISRQSAIDALRKMQTYKMFSGDDMLLIDQAGAQTELMLLPPIQPVNNSENPNSSEAISRQSVIDMLDETKRIARQNIDGAVLMTFERVFDSLVNVTNALPTIQPEPKRGKWILDRSGAYCCSKCMEPCASYVMMKPRDKFCKMCGAKMEVTT